MTTIREDFLAVLVDALAGGQPVGLDFIYGREVDGVLRPLDGQQRLTTLYLLHWYVASLTGHVTDDAPWLRFSYATRPGARMFCERLAEHPLPVDVDTPSAWITDQEWFLHGWMHDPTITAMLTMIDAIDAIIRAQQLDLGQVWQRLSDGDRPAIHFHLLALDDLESDEDLYIAMNSRGKPLTAFETFKAVFERDIQHSHRAAEFARKVDADWSNLLWEIRGDDDVVDDEFMRYIDFGTQLCQLREGKETRGRIGARAKQVFGQANVSSAENLDVLFNAFDAWQGSQAKVRATFVQYFSLAVPGQGGYDVTKVLLHSTKQTNLFDLCCRHFDSSLDRNRDFTLQHGLLLYAVLVHLWHDTPDFHRRLRGLRNLIAASENEIRRGRMPQLVAAVEALIRRGDMEGDSVFNVNQVRDELRKRRFLVQHPELESVVHRLEDHPLLQGTLTAFDLDPDLPARAVAFERAFDPDHWPLVTGALLATGPYCRRRSGWRSWSFGTGARSFPGAWRTVLTAGSYTELAQTRAVLRTFLHGVAASPVDLDEHLQSVMSGFIAGRDGSAYLDWRYYLVKYPLMRGGDEGELGRTGVYYGDDGSLGYRLCMLRTQQLNGHYKDPFLLAIRASSQSGDRVEDPWFTGYPNNPRWLRMVTSGTGIRNVAEGFQLELPSDRRQAVLHVARAIGVVEEIDGVRVLLKVPQHQRSGEWIDAVDRVDLGAELIRQLAAAGL